MKRIFDFDEVGKRVPYHVPESFFDEMQKNVMMRTVEAKPRRKYMYRLIPVIAATAAVLSAVVFLPSGIQTNNVEKLSQVVNSGSNWIEEMTDEELKAFDDFSDNDVFMY